MSSSSLSRRPGKPVPGSPAEAEAELESPPETGREQYRRWWTPIRSSRWFRAFICLVGFFPCCHIILYFGLQVRFGTEPTFLKTGDHVTPERKKWMNERQRVDREVILNFQNQSIPPRGSGVPKVGFLFLAFRELKTWRVWDRFFEGAPKDQYAIYIHFASENRTDPTFLPLARHGARIARTVKSMWCATYGIEFAGMHTMLQDPDVVQLAIIEDASVPLKSFTYVYHDLVELSPRTSKFCLASPSEYVEHRDHVFAGFIFWHGCVFMDFTSRYDTRVRKHHQMKVVSREHAVIIIQRSLQAYDVWFNAWRQSVPDWLYTGEGCSSEGVALVALLVDLQANGHASSNYESDLVRAGVEQKCLNFAHWRRCFVGTRLDLSNDLAAGRRVLKLLWDFGLLNWLRPGMNYAESSLQKALNCFPTEFPEVEPDVLERLVQSGFMFGRKFHKGAKVIAPGDSQPLPVEEVLPTLWGKVNESEARASVWTRNDASGVPRLNREPKL